MTGNCARPASLPRFHLFLSHQGEARAAPPGKGPHFIPSRAASLVKTQDQRESTGTHSEATLVGSEAKSPKFKHSLLPGVAFCFVLFFCFCQLPLQGLCRDSPALEASGNEVRRLSSSKPRLRKPSVAGAEMGAWVVVRS